MTTGFERDIERRALGTWPCLLECKKFRVRLPWAPMIAAAHDAAVLDYEGADHRIRAGLAPASRRETERQHHEVAVRCSGSHRVLRVLRDRLRGRWADFVFMIFTVVFFAFARDPDILRVRTEPLDPASARAPWAAARRAMGTR